MADTTTAPVTADTTTAPAAKPAPRLTGRMVRTLAALQALGAVSQATGVTHNAIAEVTGAQKGNQLRPLYAYGYCVASVGPRGYLNHVTAEGLAALVSAQASPGAALQPAARQALPPADQLAALLAQVAVLQAQVAATAPVPVVPEVPAAPVADPTPAPLPVQAPARKGRKGK